MHWIDLLHKFHNLSWITEINELFHNILIYWNAPVYILYTLNKIINATLLFLRCTHILEWSFIVSSLRHTCAIIMSNQHLDITPVRWMDYLGKGEVLTNTDLDRFVNNIWENTFCVHKQKQKCCINNLVQYILFIIVFIIYI